VIAAWQVSDHLVAHGLVWGSQPYLGARAVGS